jgi:hypothetical protein
VINHKELSEITDSLSEASERLRDESEGFERQSKVLDEAISKRARLRELSAAATRAGDRNRTGKRSSDDQGT